MSRRRRTTLALAAAAALVVGPAVAPVLGAPEPSLISDQLVISHLDASGLPLSSELVTQVIAVDKPYGKVLVPTATAGLHYLDQRGAPATEGEAAAVMIGGTGQSVVLIGSTFTKPLPVGLHAEYALDGATRDPASIAGEGELVIRYTVTNTVVSEQTIRYRDAAGKLITSTEPVFAPFAGTLAVTFPPGVEVVDAPTANVTTGATGGAVLTWNLVLYPPLGDYEQTVTAIVRSRDVAVPAARLTVLPVTSNEDAAVGFSRELLDSSVSGNADLADGLTELNDSALAVASGAAQLSKGLDELAEGSAALTQATSDQLVPGSTALAAGAAQQASGQASLTTGISSAATGANSLASGTETLANGLDDIASGLAALAAPSGLPAAQSAAVALAEAVNTIADSVGSPNDSAASLPPPDDVTLIALAKGSAQAAAGLRDAAAGAQTALAAVVPTLSTAAGSAGQAAAGVQGVYSAACGGTPTLTPEQCAALATAAGQASSASSDTAAAAAAVGQQAAVVGGVANGLDGLTQTLYGLAGGLESVSVALRSNDSSSPGVEEGLNQLVDALTTAVTAVTSLSEGTASSASAAHQLADGADSLASGLADASAGAEALSSSSALLATGAAAQSEGTVEIADGLTSLNDGVESAQQGGVELVDGTSALQEEGTSEVLASVVKASKDPAFARAYLAATTAKAGSAAPYAAPKGGVARVAYVSTIDAGVGDGGSEAARTTALWALGAAVVLALGVLAALRIRSTPS